MERNEPTTGEIVRELREDCNLLDDNTGKFAAAYRLESQEREIEELKAEAIVNALENAERIANLTARAESAERERDAAIDLTAIRIMRYIIENNVEIEEYDEPCILCEHNDSNHGKCGSCYSTENFELKKDLRGLQPQEGEGK